MIRCTLPWTQLIFTNNGSEVKVCDYARVSLGKQADFPTLEGVWNGKVIRAFRRLMLQGKLDNICPPGCPRLFSGISSFDKFQVPQASANHSRAIIRKVMEKGEDVVPVPPLEFNVPLARECSLHCIMCDKNTGTIKIHPNFYDILSQASDGLEVLRITGGEPFFSRKVLEMLKQAALNPPGYKFAFITSLTHLPVPLLRNLRIELINVSVDGATKSTYEAIRKGASWENLIRNFKKLLEIRSSAVEWFSISVQYTVMSRNLHEIPQVVRLFNSMEVPVIFSLVIVPPGHPQNFLEHPKLLAKAVKAVRQGLKEAQFEETRLSLSRLLIFGLVEEDWLMADAIQLFEQEKLEDAKRKVEKIIFKNPGCANGHALMGHIYNSQSKPKKAIEEFETALHLNPEADGAHCGLGLSYLQLKEYRKAEKECRMAVKKKPNFSAYHCLARVFSARKMTKRAAWAYQKALACLKKYPESLSR